MVSYTIYSGCGGGYDIFGCIPIIDKTLNNDIPIFINLSFTHKNFLDTFENEEFIIKINNNLYLVDAKKYNNNKYNFKYFPEFYFSKEIKYPIYLILKECTINEIKQCYDIIILNKKINKIYLIDGGCDVFLNGTETDLATPVEDMMHLYAINCLHIKNKFVCGIGLTCDCNSVILEELLDRLIFMKNNNIIIEDFQLNNNNECVLKYMDIVKKSDPVNTIVHSLVCARLNGYSDYDIPNYIKQRIKKTNVKIDNMLSRYIICNFDKLYASIKYLHLFDKNMTTNEIDNIITKFNDEYNK